MRSSRYAVTFSGDFDSWHADGMSSTDFERELAAERRRRLAAERLLEHKQAELTAANRQLSEHALSLTGQIMDQRKVVNSLEGEKDRVAEDLNKAKTRVVAVERLLWTALETIPDGFALFGPDTRLIAANKPYLAVFEDTGGIAPGDSYQTIIDVCLDDGLVNLQGQDEDIWYDEMLDRWNSEVIAPTTLKFWNGMHVKMIDNRTADGGMVSLALNITDTIRREQELLLARDQAQAADRAKSAFLAKMSHELRTPMNGVVGMADLLAERGLDEEGQLYTDTIRNSGRALLEIINNILDFSKLEAERMDLKAAPFDLERLVQEVAVMVGPSIAEKPLSFEVDYDQFLPTEFSGDGGRIRQILVNLVGNAIKFTDAGNIMLRIVGVCDTAGPDCELHITVEDSGMGIPDNMVSHIFAEFNQVEDESNRRYEGTGLGLAISKKLVEQMEGELWVESVPGFGSCFGFKITLPRTDTGYLPSARLPDALKFGLVWAENKLLRSVFERQLTLLGLDAWFVGSITEFNMAFEKRVPDIVVVQHSRRATVEPLMGALGPDIPIVTFAENPDEVADIPRPFTRASLLDGLARMQESAPGPPIRVLAAEDNKTNQLVFTKMLDGADIELVMVGDGAQAIEHFKRDRPDIIFMDISMPTVDGMEAARAIRDLGGPYVPIVAMTAHALSGDEERIRTSGIDDYMTKPLSKAALHDRIAQRRAEINAAPPTALKTTG